MAPNPVNWLRSRTDYNTDVRFSVPAMSAWMLLRAGAGWASEEAPMFPVWGEGVEPADDTVDESWMSLPRFRRLWQREGVSGPGGIATGGAYVVISDNGDQVVSIDPASGQDRWKVAVPSKITGPASLAVVGDRLFVAHGILGHKGTVRVTQLGVANGRLGWTRGIVCPRAELRATEAKLYLLCPARIGRSTETTVVAIDPKTGEETGRVKTQASVEVMRDGALCTLSEQEVACSTLRAGELRRHWSRKVKAKRWEHLLGTAHYLLREMDGAMEVIRPRDGSIVRILRGPIFPRVDRANDLLFLPVNDDVAIHRLRDGSRVALVRNVGRMASVLAGPSWTLLFPRSNRAGKAFLLKKNRLSRTLSDNLLGADAEAMIGDVLVTRERWWSRKHRERGMLMGYSVSEPAHPASKLEDDARVRAIVEHYHRSWEAQAALVLIAKQPHGLDCLAAIVRERHGPLLLPAIGIAGATRDLRLLPSLRDSLASIPLPPPTDSEEVRLRMTVHALATSNAPEAAGFLHDFWQRNAQRIPQGELHELLRGKILTTVWRHSAARDWDACPRRQFPVQMSSEEQNWGTASPGVGGFLDRSGRWGVLCEARSDDDGNGKLFVEAGMHGVAVGDTLRPYLVLGSGSGIEVGALLAADPLGRRLAISDGICLYLVDTTNGKASVLARADGRQRADSLQEYRAAEFSSDGRWLAYARSSGAWSQVVIRDTETGMERTLDPGPGRLAGVAFDEGTRGFAMYVWEGLDARHAEAWIRSTWTRSPCPSSAPPLGTFRPLKNAPELHKRLVPTHGGPVREADRDFELQRASFPAAEVELVPIGAKPETGLPVGPFRVMPRER